MPYPELPTERIELLYVLHPDNHLGQYDSPWINIGNFHTVLAIWTIGDMTGASNVQMRMYYASDGNGTGMTVVPDWPTTLTGVGGDGDSIVCMNRRGENIGGGWIMVRTLIQAAASMASCHLFGIIPRYVPVSTALWTEVIE